jgi:radical SAM superfamily enzyme YgiQ (UPF0313 family)
MNVLLLAPPLSGMIRANYPVSIEGDTGRYPPVGLMYLASSVEQDSAHHVDVVDLHRPLDDAAGTLPRRAPDLVGVTTTTFNLVSALRTVNAAKKRYPDVPIVVGGPHAHIYPEETLAQDNIDYVVVGEGEESLPALCRALEGTGSLGEVPGLYYRDDGVAVLSRPAEPIEDLDALPFPDRTKTDFRSYRNVTAKERYSTYVISSRGCPYRCAYCHRPHMGKRFRAMSAGRVVEEVAHCVSLGIDWVDFFDDTFTLDKKRAADICRMIIDRRIPVSWSVRTRVDRVDDGLFRLMARAGCKKVSLGIESGRQHVLDKLDKGTTLRQCDEAIASARAAGLAVYADFMLGNPGESLEDMRATVDYACSLPIQYAQFSITTPYPGTPLYEDFRRKRPELGDYWRRFARQPSSDFRTPVWAEDDFPEEEIVAIWRSAIRRFYLRPARLLGELKQQLVSFRPDRVRLAIKMLVRRTGRSP